MGGTTAKDMLAISAAKQQPPTNPEEAAFLRQAAEDMEMDEAIFNEEDLATNQV